MAFTLKENEEQARERLRAFWAGGSLGRPALLVTVTRSDYEPEPWEGPEDPKKRDLMPKWHAKRARDALGGTLYLAEAMPGVNVGWGSHLVTVATLAGGDYDYESNSAWIHQEPDLYERPLPGFDPDHPVAQQLEKCLRRAADIVGDKGFVSPPVMLDGLTTLSRFRGTENLCVELLERPDDVRAWSDALTGIYIDSYEYYYQLLRDMGYGESFTWLSVMAEGRMEAVQCDFAVTLSPDMFGRFVMPDLRRLTEYLDYSIYHLDGTCQMRFMDQLGSLPGLNGIQWNPEPGSPPPPKWVDAFRKIRGHGLCLFVWCGVEHAVAVTRELGPDGLLFALPPFESRCEAEEAMAWIEEVC